MLREPRAGGWAWAVAPDGMPSAPAASRVTTNQRMEITAVLEALRALAGGPVEVVSDSTYVVNCFRDKWYVRWAANGWRNAKKQPVANADLWRPLIELVAPTRSRSAGSRATAATASTTSSTSWPSPPSPADRSGGTRQVGMARSRSATMSSGSSRPIEIRTRPGVMPIAACSSGEG